MDRTYPPEIEALLDQGWEVNRAYLYDEEGIEGWRWLDPEGNEYTVMGDWDEPPPLPEHMQQEPR